MAEKSDSKDALEKLNKKLECSICLTDFTKPKLLPCFHVFCKKCLEPLVVQDRDVLSLQCPICRHSIQLPPKGVSGLQSDFHVDHLFEIRDALEKSQTKKCDNCEEGNATGFCRDCGHFICDACTTLHCKWKQFKDHEIISIQDAQTEATNLVQPKKQVSYCSRHPKKKLKIFCETCAELICNDCTIGDHPRPEHNYKLVTDAFPKHKDEIVASLQPAKEQLSTVTKALQAFEERVKEIEEQRMTIEAAVHKEINLLQQALEQRRTELIRKLDHFTQIKLKNLAAQRDHVELVQVKLKSCVDYVEGGLKTGTEGEVLSMKAPVMKQIEQITTDFNPAIMQPEEVANLEIKTVNTRDLQQACTQYGHIDRVEISHENSYARGDGLKRATAGEQAFAIVTTVNTANKEYTYRTNLTAELVHSKSKATVQCDIEKQQNSQYKITYQPTHRGKHELHIKINRGEIRDSPYTIAVTSSPQSLERPIRVIGNLSKPFFATTNSQNQIIVTEYGSNSVSVLSPEGKKLCSFGSEGSNKGQFASPKSVTLDHNENIYVVDTNNLRIQKFTPQGKFIKLTGTKGCNKLEFNHPIGIAFHPKNHKLYVCDHHNDRVQVLNTDLTYHSSIGRKGTGNGEFQHATVVAFNSRGDIYVTDWNNYRVQIFNKDGVFIKTFSNEDQGQKIRYYGIAIDSNDTVYVSHRDTHCISMFTSEGQYLMSFGSQGEAEGQFNYPRGLHIDKNDSLIVCDFSNGRLQIF